jgi:hypothetical protein
MKESARHVRAFEAFYAMGQGRTLRALARKLNVSHSSVKLWSRTFGWAARIEERDAAVAHIVEEKTRKVEVDRRTRNRRIVEAAIIAAARAIAEGRVRPTLADLDRMVRLESFVEGEAASSPDAVMPDLCDMTDEEVSEMAKEQMRTTYRLMKMSDPDFTVDLDEEPDGH